MNVQEEMAFSKEDRKQVYSFFEKILLDIGEPVYYDHLRGHVNKAPSNVKKYVYKECKGENLLKYFKTRKNYFNVSLRGEVSLRKSRYRLLSYQSELNDIYESDQDDSEGDNIEVPVEHPDSRSSSVSSNARNSIDCTLSLLTDAELKEKNEYEKLAKKYFCKFLNKEGRVKVSSIEIEALPKKVKRFINKYSQNKLKSFFKSYPHLFSLDEDDHVMFVSSIEEESSLELKNIQESSDSSKQTIDNFLRCAEFFVKALKQKNSTPLKNLSGTLSRAPPDVLTYLRCNYDSYKHFLTSASFLFSVDKNDKVSLIYDHSKKLKQAKKLLHSKFCTEPFQTALDNLFEPQIKTEVDPTRQIQTNEVDPDVGNTEKIGDFLNSDDVKDNVCHVTTSATGDLTVDNLKSDLIVLYYDTILQNALSSVEILQNVNSINDARSFIDFFNFTDFKTAVDEEISLIDSIKKTLVCFVESLFTAQLLCLEILEQQKILTYSHEYEAVKYFVEILEENSQGKYMLITSLKGKLGSAPRGTQSFIRQLYKGEKFISFLQTYKEFHIDPNNFWVKLSSSYKKYLKSRMETHNNFSKGIKLYELHAFFCNSHFNNVFAEVFYCIAEICRFLQNKSNCFLKSVCVIFSEFSTLEQHFESLLNDCDITKKCEKFLLYFNNLLHFTEEPKIQIRSELDEEFLLDLFHTFWTKTEVSMKSCTPYFHTLFKSHLTCETFSSDFEKKETVIEMVENALSSKSCLRYPDLPKILGFEILVSLIFDKKDSRNLIKLLEDSNLFEVKNGLVKRKYLTDLDPSKTALDLIHKALTKVDHADGNKKNEKISSSPLDLSNKVSSCDAGKKEETHVDSYCKYCNCKKGAKVMPGCELKPIDECDLTSNTQRFDLCVNKSDGKNLSYDGTDSIGERQEDTGKIKKISDSSSSDMISNDMWFCNKVRNLLLAEKGDIQKLKADSNNTFNPLPFTSSQDSEVSVSNNVCNSSYYSGIKDKKKHANKWSKYLLKSEMEGFSDKTDLENTRTPESSCMNSESIINKGKEAVTHTEENASSHNLSVGFQDSDANVNKNLNDSLCPKENLQLDREIDIVKSSRPSKDGDDSLNYHNDSKTSRMIENSLCSLDEKDKQDYTRHTSDEKDRKTIIKTDESVSHHVKSDISQNFVTEENSNSNDSSYDIEKVPCEKSEELIQLRNLTRQSDSKQNTSSSGDESDLEMRAIDNFLNCIYPEENSFLKRFERKSDHEKNRLNSSLVSSDSLIECLEFTKQDDKLNPNGTSSSSPLSNIETVKYLKAISVASSISNETEVGYATDKSVNQEDKLGISLPVNQSVKSEFVSMPKSKSEPMFDENELCNSFENFSLFESNKHSKSDSNITGNSPLVGIYKQQFKCMDKTSKSVITNRLKKLSEVYKSKYIEISKDTLKNPLKNQDCCTYTSSCEERVILKPWYKMFQNENLKSGNGKPAKPKSIFTVPTESNKASDENIVSSIIESKVGESGSINSRTKISEGDLANNSSVKELSKGNEKKDNPIPNCSKQTESNCAKSCALFSTLSKPKLDLNNIKFPSSRYENEDKVSSLFKANVKMNDEAEVNPINRACDEISSCSNQDKDSRVVLTMSNSSDSSKVDSTTSKLSTQRKESNQSEISLHNEAEKGNNENEISSVSICLTQNGNNVSSSSNISNNCKLDQTSQKFRSQENEDGNETKMPLLKELAENKGENEVKPVSNCLTPSNSKDLIAIQSSTLDNSKLVLTSMKFSAKERENDQSEISLMKQLTNVNDESKTNSTAGCLTHTENTCRISVASSTSNSSEFDSLPMKFAAVEKENSNLAEVSVLKQLEKDREIHPISNSFKESRDTTVASSTSDSSDSIAMKFTARENIIKGAVKKQLQNSFKSPSESENHCIPMRSQIPGIELNTESKNSAFSNSIHFNNQQQQIKLSGNPVASSFPELNDLNQNHNGDFQESNLSNQNSDACFLQPIQSKIIVLTLDSCVLEADIGDCKKYVFCLKSTFHCDEHSDCMDCFKSLAVGDSILCYVSPNSNSKCGNMLLSFMFCKDSDTKIEKSKFGYKKERASGYCDHNQNKTQAKQTHSSKTKAKVCDQINTLVVQKEYYKEKSSNFSYSQNQSEFLSNIKTKDSECQTDFNDQINTANDKMSEAEFRTKLSKTCECQTDFCDQKKNLVVEKACQTKCQTVSQGVQTKNSEVKLVEKECQINVQTVMQGTQTDLKLIENECQTDFIGAVKPCSVTVDEACQVSCSQNSQSVQAVSQSSEINCQTGITGAIRPLFPVSSFKCQTVLSGPVRKCVYLANKSSQSALLLGVSQATQTSNDMCKLESHLMSYSQSTDPRTVRNATAHSGQQQAADELCDMASQTISTGAIMIKKYFMEETDKNAKH